MATIQKRKKKNGVYTYRVMIRQSDGYPPSYKTFPTRQEAKDWGQQEEVRRRNGVYFPEKSSQKNTLDSLIDRYINLILPTKPKSAKDIKRHLSWWKEKLGSMYFNSLSPSMLHS